MWSRGKGIKLHKTIGRLLVITLAVQLLTQLHFHLHHVDSHDHDHTIKLHAVAVTHADDHLTHDNTRELKSAPDAIVKKSVDNGSAFFLPVFLFVLFPLVLNVIHRGRALPRKLLLRNFYYGLSPPLRAPPAV